MLATVMGLLFLGGVSVMPFVVLFGTCWRAAFLVLTFEPYRMQRAYLSSPTPSQDVFGTGYQLSQALIAFGRGEWLGVGLGQRHPEAVLPARRPTPTSSWPPYRRGVRLRRDAGGHRRLRLHHLARLPHRRARPGRQGDLLLRLCGPRARAGLGLQAFVNIGVNVGLLPTKGLTMPFMSYGSNSLIVAIMAVGVLLRIDRHPPPGRGRAHTRGGGSMGARVAVMAGGTGGHVFPALAVAERLRAEGLDVFWIGTRRGMEARLVPEHGFAMEWIGIEGLRGKGAGRPWRRRPSAWPRPCGRRGRSCAAAAPGWSWAWGASPPAPAGSWPGCWVCPW